MRICCQMLKLGCLNACGSNQDEKLSEVGAMFDERLLDVLALSETGVVGSGMFKG